MPSCDLPAAWAGHRLYSREDVETLRLFAERVQRRGCPPATRTVCKMPRRALNGIAPDRPRGIDPDPACGA